MTTTIKVSDELCDGLNEQGARALGPHTVRTSRLAQFEDAENRRWRVHPFAFATDAGSSADAG